MTLLDRLMDKVLPEPNSGCWLWAGADDGCDGYGRIVVQGHQRQAHRVSYELHKGPIPRGLEVDHLCHVRCCVNPDHLEAVTQEENLRRRMKVGSAPKSECLRGHSFDQHGYITKQGLKRCRLCDRIRSNRSYALKTGRAI